MNNKKLGIVTCGNYFKELRAVIITGEINDVELFCTKPTCSNPNKNEKARVLEHYNSYTQKVQELVLLLPLRCTGLNIGAIDSRFCHTFCSQNCTELIAPQSLVNQLIDEGNFIVTPGWLFTWKDYVQKRWQFSDESAKMFFKETTKQICVLDTGVYDDFSKPLTELCEYVGLEYKIINIGLDFFKNYVEKMVLSRQVHFQLEQSQKITEERKSGE